MGPMLHRDRTQQNFGAGSCTSAALSEHPRVGIGKYQTHKGPSETGICQRTVPANTRTSEQKIPTSPNTAKPNVEIQTASAAAVSLTMTNQKKKRAI